MIGGAATICQRLQTQLGMDNVLTNQPVSSISEYNDRVYIETKVWFTTPDGVKTKLIFKRLTWG